MASYVTGSEKHVGGGHSGTLNAAVLVGDVIVVCMGANGSGNETCSDDLGNTYTLRVANPPASQNTYQAIFTAPVTVAGTPTVTTTTTNHSTGSQVLDLFAVRGESSAVPNVSGSAHETTANPMTSTLNPSVTCTGIILYNSNAADHFSSFTPAATTINHDAGFAAAVGYILGQPSGSVAAGCNFGAGSVDNSIAVIWLPEAAAGGGGSSWGALMSDTLNQIIQV